MHILDDLCGNDKYERRILIDELLLQVLRAQSFVWNGGLESGSEGVRIFVALAV
jgi:hypothetical protein